MKIDKHLELDKNLEKDALGIEDDESEDEGIKKPGGEKEVIMGNRLDLTISNFGMSIISSDRPMAELQQILNFYLLLEMDETFRSEWLTLAKTQFKEGVKYEERK